MNRLTLALGGVAAVLVVAVVALGLYSNQPGIAGPGATPTPIPESTPSPEASVAEPTAPGTPPALTETFTSDIHGMSVSYPSGWHLQPATEPWNGDVITQLSPFADVIYEQEVDTPFIALASQPLAGQSFDDWADAYLTKVVAGGDADDASCANTPDPITVDGAVGFVPGGVGCFIALVSDGQRGYLIWLYRVDDREWFDRILATVRLRPAEARLAVGPFGIVPDGAFSNEDSGMALTVTIPSSGWKFDRTWALLDKSTEVDNDASATIAFWAFPGQEFYVPADACRMTSTRPDTPATTADELAAALAARTPPDVSEPVDVTVGGYEGKFITLHVPEDVPNDCERGDFVYYITSPDDFWRNSQNLGQVEELWILDVEGTIVIINALHPLDSAPEVVEELRTIAESTQFETP